MLAIDHLLWGVADLDEGVRRFRELSGAAATTGGVHPGFGTRNALAGLGDKLYLEILAPDPTQILVGTRGQELAALPAPTLYTFAARTDSIADTVERAEAAGLRVPQVIDMSRRHPDGRLLEWQVAFPEGHDFGRLLPFFIDWGRTAHPAKELPSAGSLAELSVGHPDREALAKLYVRLGIEVEVDATARPEIRATLSTPQGPVLLNSHPA